MREDGKIDYIEWPAGDLPATKAFYTAAFGWTFTDYGPDYAAFEGQGADGGFAVPQDGSADKPLVVLYAHDIEAMLAKVEAAGAAITKPIFSFPGGAALPLHRPFGQRAGRVERGLSRAGDMPCGVSHVQAPRSPRGTRPRACPRSEAPEKPS